MTLANIIAEAGGSIKSHPNASNISVTLYDGKDRVDTSEVVRFVEPLFAHNRREQARFFAYLAELDKHPVEAMNVRIDADYVILQYKSPKPRLFARHT